MPQTGEAAVPKPTVDAAALAAKDAAGPTATLRVSDIAYPGGPVLLQLPKATANVPGTLMGDAIGDGAGDERPPYEIRVPYTLYMGESEVSFAQWDKCVAASKCSKAIDRTAADAQNPARGVSWIMVQEYLHWLNAEAKLDPYATNRYRLPPATGAL